MSTTFTPAIWSARLNENFARATVFGSVVNTDYEGEIANQGDSVHITNLSDITVSSYDKAVGLGDPQALASSDLILTVDKADSFQFIVQDIAKIQASVELINTSTDNAAKMLAQAADKYIATLYTSVAAGNTIGDDTTPTALTVSNAYDTIVDLGVKLSEADVPMSDRWIVVPAFVQGLLLKDARFVKDTTLLQTGYIGMVNGMPLFVSNNVANTAGAKFKIMAGHKSAITFANQIVQVEQLRSQKDFGDIVRGLHVYGAKVLKPKGIAVLTANKG